MTAVWLEADVPGLVRLASLVERVNAGDAPMSVISEVRQLEDRFGLSPMARRRLLWEVEQASGGPVETGSEDPSRWLRAVSD